MQTQVKWSFRDEAIEQEKWNRLQIKRAVERATVGARFANGAATSTEGWPPEFSIFNDDMVAQFAAVKFLAKENNLDEKTKHAKRLLTGSV